MLATSVSSSTLAWRSLSVLLVVGLNRPMRLWSEKPAFRAMMVLTASTFASAGTSTVSGRPRMGFLGAAGGFR